MKRGSALAVGGWMILAVAVGAAPGQTTQRAGAHEPTPWQKTVHQFAEALAKGDKASLQSLLADKPVLHLFNAQATQSVDDLLTLGKSIDKTIGWRGYQGAPPAMAADMAADFKANARELPEELRRQMIPLDASVMAKANATAVQWFEINFEIKPGEWNSIPVGVVELWINSGDQHKLAFVLLRGQQDAQGTFHISAVAWGDPLAEKK